MNFYIRSFSTLQPYVQNILWDNQAIVYEDIVTKKGHFYVCGDVRMADDVVNTLVSIFEAVGNMSREEADEYFETLKVRILHQCLVVFS